MFFKKKINRNNPLIFEAKSYFYMLEVEGHDVDINTP